MKNQPEIIIDLSDLLNKGVGAVEEQNIETVIQAFDEFILHKPLKIKIVLVNLGENIAATVITEPHIKTECTRCLKQFDYVMKLKFEQVFSYQPETDEFIIKNNSIDLYPAIRQEIIINFPLQALCAEKCKGIKAKN